VYNDLEHDLLVLYDISDDLVENIIDTGYTFKEHSGTTFRFVKDNKLVKYAGKK
jgi:hypothetical protein